MVATSFVSTFDTSSRIILLIFNFKKQKTKVTWRVGWVQTAYGDTCIDKGIQADIVGVFVTG